MQEYQEEIQQQEVPVAEKPKTMKRLAGILFVALIAIGGWLYYRKVGLPQAIFSSNAKLTDIQQKALASEYVAQVGKHMLLPLDDQPIVATVDDPALLIKQQAFFLGSVKGDVVLIFPKTQRAILFSPSRNKIVNAGPIISGSQGKPVSASSTAS